MQTDREKEEKDRKLERERGGKTDSQWGVTNYSLSHDALDGLQSEKTRAVICRGSAALGPECSHQSQ